MNNGVEERLKEIKKDLENDLSPIEIVRKHVIFGECCELSPQDYFNLRSEVAKNFKLHPNEVLVVGSAKLGFSIAPKKEYELFSDESDIDIALVSPTLFEKYWRQAYGFKDSVPYWRDYWKGYEKFVESLFYGWIRPDKFPDSAYFPLGKDWWDFFEDIASSGRYGHYDIRGGLYQSHYFLENYQKISIEKWKKKLGGTE